jgi:heme-degrading monooxygenase HmoA
MYARMSRFAGLPPERINETLEGFEKAMLPAFEQLDGFKGVMVLVDRTEGKAAAITFWESQQDLRASDKLADQAREQAMETAQATGPARDPLIDRYEVVLQK